jgi:hypothetical protein
MKLVSAAFIVTVHQNDLRPDLVLFPALEMLKASKPDNVFLEAGRASVRMLCSCARTGTQPFSRIPLRMEEVGRKLYLSETPSIGWEAKTLGAKRRISSSEIATVPGTLDRVELLFCAVLMLVDLVSWFSRAAAERRGRRPGRARAPRMRGLRIEMAGAAQAHETRKAAF